MYRIAGKNTQLRENKESKVRKQSNQISIIATI